VVFPNQLKKNNVPPRIRRDDQLSNRDEEVRRESAKAIDKEECVETHVRAKQFPRHLEYGLSRRQGFVLRVGPLAEIASKVPLITEVILHVCCALK